MEEEDGALLLTCCQKALRTRKIVKIMSTVPKKLLSSQRVPPLSGWLLELHEWETPLEMCRGEASWFGIVNQKEGSSR